MKMPGLILSVSLKMILMMNSRVSMEVIRILETFRNGHCAN